MKNKTVSIFKWQMKKEKRKKIHFTFYLKKGAGGPQ